MRLKPKKNWWMIFATVICSSCAPAQCPALHQWTPQEQNQMADEIEALPPSDDLLISAFEDYDQLRKACKKASLF